MQAISYKHFMEVTIPNSLPNWPFNILQQIDNKILELTKMNFSQLMHSYRCNSAQFVQDRQDITEEVAELFKLRQDYQQYPLKKIMDRMRNHITDYIKKHGADVHEKQAQRIQRNVGDDIKRNFDLAFTTRNPTESSLLD